MFLIIGEKKALIKYQYDNLTQCTYCESHNLSFAVYRDYFHLYYVPVVPVDEKEIVCLCLDCGEVNKGNRRIEHFREITRTPIYFYSGLIFVLGCILAIVTAQTI
jgi:hypothetical protein